MVGVDRFDQHLTNYPIIKKRGKKFYYKIFLHLLDQTIWNSYVIYTKRGGMKTHLQFRLDLIEEICDNRRISWTSIIHTTDIAIIGKAFFGIHTPNGEKR